MLAGTEDKEVFRGLCLLGQRQGKTTRFPVLSSFLVPGSGSRAQFFLPLTQTSASSSPWALYRNTGTSNLTRKAPESAPWLVAPWLRSARSGRHTDQYPVPQHPIAAPKGHELMICAIDLRRSSTVVGHTHDFVVPHQCSSSSHCPMHCLHWM